MGLMEELIYIVLAVVFGAALVWFLFGMCGCLGLVIVCVGAAIINKVTDKGGNVG